MCPRAVSRGHKFAALLGGTFCQAISESKWHPASFKMNTSVWCGCFFFFFSCLIYHIFFSCLIYSVLENNTPECPSPRRCPTSCTTMNPCTSCVCDGLGDDKSRHALLLLLSDYVSERQLSGTQTAWGTLPCRSPWKAILSLWLDCQSRTWAFLPTQV